MSWRALLGELIVLMLTASIVAGAQDAPVRGSPPLHRGPGGTHVPGDTTYHGSGGP